MGVTDNSSILVKEISVSLKQFGSQRVISILSDARKIAQEERLFENKNVDLVTKLICKEFELSPAELINSKNKLNKRKIAFSLIIYYLHNSFNMSFGDLKIIFKKDRALFFRYNELVMKGIKNKTENIIKLKNKFDLIIKKKKSNSIN